MNPRMGVVRTELTLDQGTIVQLAIETGGQTPTWNARGTWDKRVGVTHGGDPWGRHGAG